MQGVSMTCARPCGLFFVGIRAGFCAALLLTGLCVLWHGTTAHAQVTLLIPSQPSVEAPATPAAPAQAKRTEKGGDEARPENPAAKDTPAENTAPPAQAPALPPTPVIEEEVDVLVSMMQPFRHEGLDMDMPQMFAVLRYDSDTPVHSGMLQPERRDLLGDMEEIRYLDRKAWGANVALSAPGFYQFVIESRPWWDAARDCFVQHHVKTSLPVHGKSHGWSQPVGQRLEIVPLSRPFGLTAPALFAGVALMEGKALPQAEVRMVRINTEKLSAPTPWHEELAARTDANGQFAFVPNRPGWWCCTVTTPGTPLKGPDGQPKPLHVSALFWLYVDAPATEAKR